MKIQLSDYFQREIDNDPQLMKIYCWDTLEIHTLFFNWIEIVKLDWENLDFPCKYRWIVYYIKCTFIMMIKL